MSRRSARSAEQNLDSLLDTMANVTGILVVLLAVTQISVGEAVDRLRDRLAERPELSRESLALAEEQAAELERQLAPLLPGAEERLALRDEQREELAALRGRIATLDRRVAERRGGPGDEGEARRRIAAAESRAAELERAITTLRREGAQLQARLEKPAAAATAREARLPDPRPPPAGAQREIFLVRYGRIQRIDEDDLLARLWGGIRTATGGTTPEQLQRSSLERNRVLQYFRSNDVGTADYRWHVVDVGGTLTGQLGWRDRSVGESLAQISSGLSSYRADLLRLSPARVYFRYFVWDDSFEVYEAARRQADKAGFAAGWEPMAADQPLRQPLANLPIRDTID